MIAEILDMLYGRKYGAVALLLLVIVDSIMVIMTLLDMIPSIVSIVMVWVFWAIFTIGLIINSRYRRKRYVW